MRFFRLTPFPWQPAPPALEIAASIALTSTGLAVLFALSGDLAALVVAAQPERPERRDNLWRSTCIEGFAARAGGAAYPKINLASSGDWNAYPFSGYRKEMAPAEVARFLSRRTADAHELRL